MKPYLPILTLLLYFCLVSACQQKKVNSPTENKPPSSTNKSTKNPPTVNPIEAQKKVTDNSNNAVSESNNESILKEAGQAKRIRFKSKTFDTYQVNLTQQQVRMFLDDPTGKKIRSLDTLKQLVEGEGMTLLMATNAGIYLENYYPQGLYIEQSKKIRPLNLKSVKGLYNFFMKPNGVFYLSSNQAYITESHAFEKVKANVQYATQSGPLLLHQKKLHPKISPTGTSRYIRSGVGVINEKELVFAISNQPVTFYEFATLFSEYFQCTDALYLDGAISRMYLPALNRKQLGGDFGAMIAVLAP